jgi:hypothetical protein
MSRSCGVPVGASPCPYARQIRSPHRGQGPWCPSPRCRRFSHVGDHDERKKPGQPRRDDRSSFDGLIWLARTGSPWPQLPREFGARPSVHHGCSEWIAYVVRERTRAANRRTIAIGP